MLQSYYVLLRISLNRVFLQSPSISVSDDDYRLSILDPLSDEASAVVVKPVTPYEQPLAHPANSSLVFFEQMEPVLKKYDNRGEIGFTDPRKQSDKLRGFLLASLEIARSWVGRRAVATVLAISAITSSSPSPSVGLRTVLSDLLTGSLICILAKHKYD